MRSVVRVHLSPPSTFSGFYVQKKWTDRILHLENCIENRLIKDKEKKKKKSLASKKYENYWKRSKSWRRSSSKVFLDYDERERTFNACEGSHDVLIVCS